VYGLTVGAEATIAPTFRSRFAQPSSRLPMPGANVVFPCGVVHDPSSGEVRLYYGAADSSVCLATAQLDELLDAVLAAPPAA
jgi:hypothetical protein